MPGGTEDDPCTQLRNTSFCWQPVTSSQLAGAEPFELFRSTLVQRAAAQLGNLDHHGSATTEQSLLLSTLPFPLAC